MPAKWPTQGADIIDIGAESTRPYGGLVPVTADDEKARLARIACGRRARRAGVDRHHQGLMAAWAIEQGAAIVKMSGVCNAIPNGIPRRRTRRAGHRNAQSRARRIRPSTSSPT